MTIATRNTLRIFKCKNITMKNSGFQKLLSAIIDKKLDFTEDLTKVCKNANRKLHDLNRIFKFSFPERHVLIINAFIKSLFNYCQVVQILCYLRILNKIPEDDFPDILRFPGGISIHQMYKLIIIQKAEYIHGLSSEIMNKYL